MPKPERGEGQNGTTRSVRIVIRGLDPDKHTGKATASPRRLRLRPDDQVIWTFDGFDSDRYRPEIRFLGESPVGQPQTNGQQVESAACGDRRGIHGYEVWLQPCEGVVAAAIKLEIVNPPDAQLGMPALKPDPPPPDLLVR